VTTEPATRGLSGIAAGTASVLENLGWVTLAELAVPFVLVLADRTGADIEVHRAASAPSAARETVTGQTFYITKVAEGDWAQKQFQQTAENAWRDNARLVTEEVRSLVRRHRPRAVLIAGDVRARSAIAADLEARDPVSPGVAVLEVEAGGRADGASREALWEEVRDHLTRLSAEADADLAGRLDEARGRGEGAAHGVDEVVDALSQARVERLVLDLGRARESVVKPADHDGLPVPSAAREGEVPADRVLIAAAALTDAELSLLPAGMGRGGGVSALLRWSA